VIMNNDPEQLDRLLETLNTICPSHPEDTPNAPLLRRLHLLFQAARAIAAALPDNGGLDVAEAADLTVAAYATADYVHATAKQHPPTTTGLAGIVQFPAGYSLSTFTETATGGQ